MCHIHAWNCRFTGRLLQASFGRYARVDTQDDHNREHGRRRGKKHEDTPWQSLSQGRLFWSCCRIRFHDLWLFYRRCIRHIGFHWRTPLLKRELVVLPYTSAMPDRPPNGFRAAD